MNKEIQLDCFKAYDVRGRVPDELNTEIAWRIGRAYAEYLKPKRVVLGRDVRLSSEELALAVSRGLRDGGVDVFNIGVGGTEEVYFATFHAEMDGGIMVTASHNPMDFNGMKFVKKRSKPISGDTGLHEIRELAERGDFTAKTVSGVECQLAIETDYVNHLLGYVDPGSLKPLKIVTNPGNGGAGKIVDLLEQHLPFEFIKIQHEMDGNFPNGIPNPLLPEHRSATADAIISTNADLGIAWDGDFDRCFFFDETGNFIEGYYIVGLLAEAFLTKGLPQKIVHDPRLTWNTIDIVNSLNGIPIQSKTGHAFIKDCMAKEDAVYGGEMSAHHYFRDFAYCDNGMIPWLLVTELMSKANRNISALVSRRMSLFPVSGEINRRLPDPKGTIFSIEEIYKPTANCVDYTDGLSMEFTDWRFNIRCSNTEPLLRLNVESRGDRGLMETETAKLLELIDRK